MVEKVTSTYTVNKNNKGVPLSKLFVKVNNKNTTGGKDEYISLDKLRIHRSHGEDSAVSSLEQFEEELKKSGNGDLIYNGYRLNSDKNVYKETVHLPKTFVSDYVEVKDEQIPYGLKRVHNVEKANSTIVGGANPYVLVKLAGQDKYTLVDGKKLKYYSNGVEQTLEGKDLNVFNLPEDISLFTEDNKRVESVYAGTTFSIIEKAVATEQAKDNELSFSTFELDENGEPTLDKDGKYKKVTESVEPVYSEHEFVKVGETPYIQATNYQASMDENGDFVRVSLKGSGEKTLVNIDELYLKGVNGERSENKLPTDYKESQKSVGKSVFVKLPNGTFAETEPLRAQEILVRYTKQETLAETTKEEDILTDNSYLRLQNNGKYVKEQDVIKPIFFNFVEETADYDKLLVIYQKEGKDLSVIVPKDTFKNSPTVNYDGVTLNAKDAYHVVRSTEKDSSAIQTSSMGRNFESALITHKFDRVRGKVSTEIVEGLNVEEQIKAILELYKKGEYEIDNFMDENGNLVVLDKEKKRFIKTDKVLLRDYLGETNPYKYLKDNKITIENGQVKGGPKYDAKKGIKGDFKKCSKAYITFFTLTFSFPGLLLFAASPALFGVLAGAAALTALIIPFKNLIQKWRINKNYKYKDRTEKNRKHWTKDFEKEFQKMYEQGLDESNMRELKFLTKRIKKLSKQVKKDPSKQADLDRYTKLLELKNNPPKGTELDDKRLNDKERFLTKFALLENRMLALHTSKYISEFSLKDGKAQINAGNAAQMTTFLNELKKYDDQIKSLEKYVKSHKDKQTEAYLASLKASREGMVQHYVSRGVITPKSKQLEKLQQKANRFKGFMLAKFYGEELKDENGKSLLTTEKIILNNLFMENGNFKLPRRLHLTEEEKKALKQLKQSAKSKDIKKSTEDCLKKCGFFGRKSSNKKTLDDMMYKSSVVTASKTPGVKKPASTKSKTREVDFAKQQQQEKEKEIRELLEKYTNALNDKKTSSSDLEKMQQKLIENDVIVKGLTKSTAKKNEVARQFYLSELQKIKKVVNKMKKIEPQSRTKSNPNPSYDFSSVGEIQNIVKYLNSEHVKNVLRFVKGNLSNYKTEIGSNYTDIINFIQTHSKGFSSDLRDYTM